MTETKEQIVARLRDMQKTARINLDTAREKLANLSAIPYRSENPERIMTSEPWVVAEFADNPPNTFNDLLERVQETMSKTSDTVTYDNFHFSPSCEWEFRCTVLVLTGPHLELPDQYMARIEREKQDHDRTEMVRVNRLKKQYEKEIQSLERRLNGFVTHEERLMLDPIEIVRKDALAKLTEVERKALGLL